MSPLPTGTRFPIQVISTVKPVNGAPIPVVSDVDVEGGYQVRTDLTDRDTIPLANRKEGMLVYVQSDDNFYTLSGGITNADWVVRDFGGGGGTLAGDVTGPAGTNTISALNGITIDASSPPQGGSLHYVQTTDLALFPQPQAMYTDGTFVWTGNYRTKIITKTRLSTRVSTNIDLTSVMPGPVTSFCRNIKSSSDWPNYIFVSTMDSTRVLILDKNSNAVVGIGSVGTDRVRCVELDNLGNVWAGSHSGSSQLYRFNVANMISSYPTVVSPASSVTMADTDVEELAFDGTHLWLVTFDGFLEKINVSGSGSSLGNYTDGTWYADVVCSGGFIWVLNQQNTSILKFDPTTFASGPIDSVILTNVQYLNAFNVANGFLWVPDNSSSSGVDRDNVIKVQMSPLAQLAAINPPGTETEWFECVSDPTLNRLYVAVYADSVSGRKGFRVLDTSTDTWIDSFTQSSPPIIKYIPAACTNVTRPASPFVGQMVFITDLDTPGPIAVWWNGSNWVDDQGFTR